MVLYLFFSDIISIGLEIFFTWGILTPFAIGTFYYLLISSYQNIFGSFIDSYSIELILRIYFFGFLITGWVSSLILSGSIDSILLTIGYVPIYENIVFAIITTWSAIINYPNNINDNNNNVDGETTNNISKLKSAFEALTILSHFNLIDSIRKRFFIIALSIFIEDSMSLFYDMRNSIKFYYLGVYVSFAMLLFNVLYSPVSQWMRLYYKSIKDENYLIGMELQNSVEV